MLTINIRNDGTGTDASANYVYWVAINLEPAIARGCIKGHNRADGWRELVRMVADSKEEASDGRRSR